MVDTAKTPRFVVDASTVVAILLIDEVFTKPALKIIEYYQNKKIEIIAPALLSYEVINALRSACLSKRVPETDVLELIEAYKKLKIPLLLPDEQNMITIANSVNISVYDSAYLSLAISSNTPLISADRKFYNKLKSHSYKKKVIWIENFNYKTKEVLN